MLFITMETTQKPYDIMIRLYTIDPKDSNALNGKGNALSGQGNYTQAIKSYDKALTLDPKDKVILRNKADALLNQALYTIRSFTTKVISHQLYKIMIKPYKLYNIMIKH